MKWSIVVLIMLGLAASLAAAVLFLSIQGRTLEREVAAASPAEPAPPPEVPVLTAVRDLGMRTIVTAPDVELRVVAEHLFPAGALADPIQAVGKVLLSPVLAGQALTAECFPGGDDRLRLASSLEPGRRAVSIELGDDMGIESLLYPGCMVDVIASCEVDGDIGKRPISFVLLEKVLVLGIGEDTIVGPAEASGPRAQSRRPSVTLLLNAEEVKSVKLAMERGSLSLSMRNPLDDSASASDAVGLAALSPVLAEAESSARETLARRTDEDLEKRRYEMEKERQAIQRVREEAELARLRYEQEKVRLENAALEELPAKEVLILRGGSAETKTFRPMPSANS